jgi:hypothetical protein
MAEKTFTSQPASAAPNDSSDTLGSSTNSLTSTKTTITNSPTPIAKSAAAMRYALQAKARALLPDHRVGWCMRRFRAERSRIDVVHAKARRSAYFDGLMRCGRVWVCPVCAAKISETRRVELNELLLDAREIAIGYTSDEPEYYPRWYLTMLTFTIAHKAHESAADVLARLNLTWTRYSEGKWTTNFRRRFYIVGTLRALEMTHGANGWHPHYHLLMFHDSVLRKKPTPPLYAPSLTEMIAAVQVRWSDIAAKVGGYADKFIGVELTLGKVHEYPIKADAERELKRWGMTSEITKQPSKRGRNDNRSLTDLLIDAAKGDDLAAALWIEATNALARQKQLEPSKGLWLMLGRKLRSDEDAAEDQTEPSDRVLASLTWESWKRILEADARATLLDIASTGDTLALWAYLESIGVYPDERS